MARIGGVGAKKLESYGAVFLEVITGAAGALHPSRMKLAGRPEGSLYDRLHDAQSRLARGPDGTGKYMSVDAPAPQKQLLRQEIDTNIAELDALVEEVLLASRLDSARETPQDETIELLALAAEEAARVDAEAHGYSVEVTGNERLLRRALRNLLENARRYGGDDVAVAVKAMPGGGP